MSPIHPKGEKLKQAIKWISEHLKEDENATVADLIQKASFQFNLSPKDEVFLVSFYRENPEG